MFIVIFNFRRKLEKKQEGDEVPKKLPHTLESLREKDETTVENAEAEEQEEVNIIFLFFTFYIHIRLDLFDL